MFSMKKENIYRAGVILSTSTSSMSYILVVKGRKSGKWSFPKGHVEKNEDIKTCAIRELCEETGLKIDVNILRGFININGTAYFRLITPKCVNSNSNDKKEIKRCQWISTNNLLKLQRPEVNSDLWRFVSFLKTKEIEKEKKL